MTRLFTVLKIVKAEEKIPTDTEVSLISYKIVNADLARAMKTIKPCKKKKNWKNTFICVSGWRHPELNAKIGNWG